MSENFNFLSPCNFLTHNAAEKHSHNKLRLR